MVHPYISGLRGGYTIFFGLVKKVHNWLVALLDISPISAYSLAKGANYRAERGSTGELFRVPGIPIADGGDKAVKINGVHGLGDLFGVCGIPKQGAFLYGRSPFIEQGVSKKRVECCQQRD